MPRRNHDPRLYKVGNVDEYRIERLERIAADLQVPFGQTAENEGFLGAHEPNSITVGRLVTNYRLQRAVRSLIRSATTHELQVQRSSALALRYAVAPWMRIAGIYDVAVLLDELSRRPDYPSTAASYQVAELRRFEIVPGRQEGRGTVMAYLGYDPEVADAVGWEGTFVRKALGAFDPFAMSSTQSRLPLLDVEAFGSRGDWSGFYQSVANSSDYYAGVAVELGEMTLVPIVQYDLSVEE